MELPFTVANGAPATTVLPEIATEKPSWSKAAPSEAVSLAASVSLAQPPEGFTNTYAAPWAIAGAFNKVNGKFVRVCRAIATRVLHPV